MTLVNSLPSAGGLNLSPIDEDIRFVEERLAARLIKRLGLRPPIDVRRIASSYAAVTVKQFPIKIDGICLDLKKPGVRPKIWLSKDIGWVRQRFTLAHEIGHIIIPWHAGTITDDLDAARDGPKSSYRQMEAEANRFAAELLMPTEWVKDLAKRVDHASALMNTVLQVADVSHQAAWIRTERYGPTGFVGAIVQDGVIVESRCTRGTRSRPLREGTNLDVADVRLLMEPMSIANGDVHYYWWRVCEEVEVPAAPEETWRNILDSILLTLPLDERESCKRRVNAIAGVAIGKLERGSRVKDIYRSAIAAFENRSDRDRWLAMVSTHPNFQDYLLARSYDRATAPQ